MLIRKVFILALLVSSFTFAQQGQFFDAPFGGGIGYIPAWYIPNVDPVNTELKTIGMEELSTGGFYSSGIAGFLYIGFVKHLRIGGMGYGGSVSSKQEINNLNREVVYSLNGGGVTIEYTLPFIKDVGVSVGAAIGSGSLDVEIFSNDGSFNWGNIWEELSDPGNQSGNTYHKLENSFWMFTPTLNIDVPVYRFVTLRIGVGYQVTFGDSWKADNGQGISGVPDNLNGSSLFFQSGLFIGFFSY